MKFVSSSGVVLLLLFLSGCTVFEAGNLKIIDIWAQAALLAYSDKMSEHAYHIPVGSDAPVYFQIVNEGEEKDTLIGGFSEICERVEIVGAEGNKIHLEPGEKVVLSPKSGLSVQLRKLKQDLLPAQKIKLILIFERQGEVELTVPVKLPQN
jgi:copper(I)-binding protein